MLSTRLHGIIDYGVAALFARYAAASSLPPGTRAALGALGTYHAGSAALTDYEAGFRPALSMRQHLALDALGAAALLGAGLALRRQSPATRALLLAAGLAECVLVAASDPVPELGPGAPVRWAGRMAGALAPDQVGDPPLDQLKPIAPDLFIADSVLPRPMGILLPIRMTVIRLPNHDLVLHSPVNLTPGLQQELAELGTVRHLVAPSSTHWLFLRAWQAAYPDAMTWATPGLRERRPVRRNRVRVDRVLTEHLPPHWPGLRLVTVPGGLGFHETALLHEPSRTLLLTDLVLNIQPQQMPAWTKPGMRLLGIVGSDGMPPVYVRGVIKLRRRAARAAADRLLALQPERVVFAHGPWFTHDGTAALRHALRWLLA